MDMVASEKVFISDMFHIEVIVQFRHFIGLQD